jgi:hypothetical protein
MKIEVMYGAQFAQAKSPEWDLDFGDSAVVGVDVDA